MTMKTELEVVAFQDHNGNLLPVERLVGQPPHSRALTPLLPAQERIRALEEERHGHKVTAEEGSEIVAELSTALAVLHNEELEPCKSPCAGHLGPKARGAFNSSLKWVQELMAERDALAERVAQNVLALSERYVLLAEVRPLVRALKDVAFAKKSGSPVLDSCMDDAVHALGALSPATRKWAEGSQEEGGAALRAELDREGGKG